MPNGTRNDNDSITIDSTQISSDFFKIIATITKHNFLPSQLAQLLKDFPLSKQDTGLPQLLSIKNSLGQTLLHYALDQQNLSLVRALVEYIKHHGSTSLSSHGIDEWRNSFRLLGVSSTSWTVSIRAATTGDLSTIQRC